MVALRMDSRGKNALKKGVSNAELEVVRNEAEGAERRPSQVAKAPILV